MTTKTKTTTTKIGKQRRRRRRQNKSDNTDDKMKKIKRTSRIVLVRISNNLRIVIRLLLILLRVGFCIFDAEATLLLLPRWERVL